MKKQPAKSTAKKTSKKNSDDKTSEKKQENKQNINKEDQEFPGYPHYPNSDDIMNPSKGMEKEDIDVEDFSRSVKPEKKSGRKKTSRSDNSNDLNEKPEIPNLDKEEDLEIVPGTDADVTEEDLELLGSDELSDDLGEDEELKQRVYPVDMSAKDLDVPGSEDDDESEEIGSEDEENNPYSIGGDRHQDLEEEEDPGR